MLLLGSVLYVGDNLIHPKEYAPGHEAKQLAEIAGHYKQWQAAHVLGLGSIFCITAGVLGITFLIRRRAPGLGLAGGVLTIMGLLGFATVIGLDGYTWAIVGEVSQKPVADPKTAALVLHDLQNSPWSIPYYLPAAGFLFGTVILAVGMVRTHAVAPWVGWMFGLGGVLVGLEGVIHANWFFITGALVLALGTCGIAGAIAGMSDEEFADGGPARRQAGIGSSASAP